MNKLEELKRKAEELEKTEIKEENTSLILDEVDSLYDSLIQELNNLTDSLNIEENED
jgi:thymidine kinase